MGPNWATRIWANPCGTHAEPGSRCTPHMGSPYGTHIGMFAGCTPDRAQTLGLKSTRSSHNAQYCRYQTYSDALKNSFPPGIVPAFGGQFPDH